jgi:nucleotide-binding universal stress UspA family protein
MKVSRRFKKLLAAISLEERTPAVVNFARRIAEVNEGEVVLLHAVPTQSYRLHRPVYRPEEAGGANEEHARASRARCSRTSPASISVTFRGE